MRTDSLKYLSNSQMKSWQCIPILFLNAKVDEIQAGAVKRLLVTPDIDTKNWCDVQGLDDIFHILNGNGYYNKVVQRMLNLKDPADYKAHIKIFHEKLRYFNEISRSRELYEEAIGFNPEIGILSANFVKDTFGYRAAKTAVDWMNLSDRTIQRGKKYIHTGVIRLNPAVALTSDPGERRFLMYLRDQKQKELDGLVHLSTLTSAYDLTKHKEVAKQIGLSAKDDPFSKPPKSDGKKNKKPNEEDDEQK